MTGMRDVLEVLDSLVVNVKWTNDTTKYSVSSLTKLAVLRPWAVSIFELFDSALDSGEDSRSVSNSKDNYCHQFFFQNRFGFRVGSFEEAKLQRSESREPTNILYVAIKVKDSENDAEVSKKLDSFCEGRLTQLKEGNLRWLTFIILKSKSK